MQLTFEEIFGKWDGFEYIERRQKSYKLVYGIGTNDSTFQVVPTKQTRHPAYSTWVSMLERCYSSKYKEKYPTYKDVTCCDNWLLFTNFAIWFKDRYIKDQHLDKDILVKNNKIYSPNTCIFAPKEINMFLTIRSSERGEQPLGVQLHKGRFIARIGAERFNLGSFDTSKEAHRAWQKAKLEQAIAFNFPPLQRVIDQLIFEIENNLETTSL